MFTFHSNVVFLLILLLLFLLKFLSTTSGRTFYDGREDKPDPHHWPTPRIQSKRDTVNSKLKSPWKNTNWESLGRQRIESAISLEEKPKNTKPAKNVILFLGDGMGLPSVSASRLLKAEKNNLKGENIYLEWENFPYAGLCRTYNVDRSTPDSAGTATAYLTGVKTNYGTIGVNDNVTFGDCSNIRGNELESILHKSIAAEKWTGVVTTTRITHASPAGCYASTAFRDWEGSLPDNSELAKNCQDIAYQLVHAERNRDIRVIFGGGSSQFLPNNTDPDDPDVGSRTDDKNLLDEWHRIKKADGLKAALLRTRTDFDGFDPKENDYVLGLFRPSHLSFEADRDKCKEPSLAELTKKAIHLLERNSKGFFLFVEGGRIDHAHHDNNAYRALHDTLALEQAVKEAVSLTDPEETLILVTADHSHVFNLGGYAPFEESIFGFADFEEEPAQDEKPYTQLMYANGPGYERHRVKRDGEKTVEGLREDLTNSTEVYEKDFLQDSGVWLKAETHGGEDVAVYASGPWSHLFQKTEEQTYVAHVMMFASCVGQYSNELHCNSPKITSSAGLFFVALLTLWKLYRPID